MKIKNFAEHINKSNLLETNLHQNGYWTEEQLKEEANKYKTIKEFRKNNYNAYQTSKKRKLLSIFFKND
jgi:hypothetical protein